MAGFAHKFAAIIHDCVCQGYNLTYECTVIDGAATIWRGTAFDCPMTNNELVILSMEFISRSCSNNALLLQTIRSENGSSTSQLTVQISDEINGTTVECAYDNGHIINTIDSAMILVTTGIICMQLHYYCNNAVCIYKLITIMHFM